MIDYGRYEVDLLLFRKEGLYLNQLNPKVNLLPVLPEYEEVDSNKKYIIWAIKHAKFISASKKIFYFLQEKKNFKNVNKSRWELCWKKRLPVLNKEYDVAVGYLHGLPLWYVADKVKAKKKIGWIHNFYGNIRRDEAFDYQFFKKLDHLVSVSEECTESLRTTFPDIKDITLTLLNLTSPKTVIKKSLEKGGFDDSYNGIKLLTIGALRKQKGYEIAIEACYLLKKKGIRFRWYIIGIGALKETLDKMIKRFDVQNEFVFLGEKSNPYPYIRQADIYVQTSYYEGKSIAIDEAKILFKPILVTNFPSVDDQIVRDKTGLIVEINPSAIAEGLEKMITNYDLRSTFSKNLELNGFESVEEELQKHYDLFESKCSN